MGGPSEKSGQWVGTMPAVWAQNPTNRSLGGRVLGNSGIGKHICGSAAVIREDSTKENIFRKKSACWMDYCLMPPLSEQVSARVLPAPPFLVPAKVKTDVL